MAIDPQISIDSEATPQNVTTLASIRPSDLSYFIDRLGVPLGAKISIFSSDASFGTYLRMTDLNHLALDW